MKILHLLDSLNRGGTEIQALDTVRNAARFGIDLTMAAAGGGDIEADMATAAELVRFDRKLPVDLRLVTRLRRLIRDRGIQLVRGFQPVEGIHLYLATRGLKVPCVLSFEGFIPDVKNRRTARFLIPRMAANIAVSDGLKKWLARKDGLDTKDFVVIHNGADPQRLRPSGRSVKAELGIAADEIVIGMIGNFYRDPRKDQLTVVRSLPAILKRHANVHCVFAGGVEKGAEDKFNECRRFCLEHAIEHRVHFLGSRGDVPDILAELDIFIFSSLQEGLPVAASEAMLAGSPLVISDIEPLIEATGGGEFARVFPVGDHAALAAAVDQLLANDDERHELARRACEFAEANFSIDAHLSQLKALYSQILTRGRRR